jgi:hypothetical protein
MFCCEIISGLWIGDCDIMNSHKFVDENKIQLIFNFTVDSRLIHREGVRLISVPVTEQLSNSLDVMELNKYLKDILNHIKNNTDKCNILLSCHDGRTVPALVVALYIIKYTSSPPETVRGLLQSKCPDIPLDYDLSGFDI